MRNTETDQVALSRSGASLRTSPMEVEEGKEKGEGGKWAGRAAMLALSLLLLVTGVPPFVENFVSMFEGLSSVIASFSGSSGTSVVVGDLAAGVVLGAGVPAVAGAAVIGTGQGVQYVTDRMGEGAVEYRKHNPVQESHRIKDLGHTAAAGLDKAMRRTPTSVGNRDLSDTGSKASTTDFRQQPLTPPQHREIEAEPKARVPMGASMRHTPTSVGNRDLSDTGSKASTTDFRQQPLTPSEHREIEAEPQARVPMGASRGRFDEVKIKIPQELSTSLVELQIEPVSQRSFSATQETSSETSERNAKEKSTGR